MRKNLLILKRNILMTLLEIFYPILLMLIGYLVEKAFGSTKYTWEGEKSLDEYLIDKGNMAMDFSIYPFLQLSQTMEPDAFQAYLDLKYPSEKNSINNYLNTIGNSFDKGKGIWNYIDPLNEVHPTELVKLSGLPFKPLTMICYNRFHIAFVGFTKDSQLGQEIITYISVENQVLKRDYQYKEFKDINELNDYVSSEDYGKPEKPTICFGIYFKKNGEKDYSASLHYFSDFISHGIEDVPNNLKEPNEEMQQGPNMNDIIKYSNNGYIQVMNILTNHILKEVTSSPASYINYGFAVQKYDSYKYNEFASFAGLYFTFFMVLSYLCPLILYVLKMVVEKESRSKEVMKIMGMGEGTYFLTYFVEFFIVNIFYAFIVGIIAHLMFPKIPYLYLVLYLWLFGLNIFALSFFCQSFMDTTRLALIISCLIYCLMLFVSAAVYDENIKKIYKIIAALLPPVNLLLGAFTFGHFQGMFYQFSSNNVTPNYLNYSIETTYLMFTLDFFIYLFLGYYLQNVIPHEYGASKPWYFLFLPSYWCGSCCSSKKRKEKKNKEKEEESQKERTSTRKDLINGQEDVINIKKNRIKNDDKGSKNSSIFDDNPHSGDIDFQNEDLYRDRDKNNDVFMLRDVTKVYSDGKMACNKISFNLFRNEIFALLGRNGAGKTSLINGK